MCTSQTTTRRRYPSRVSLGGFRKKHLEIVFCLLAGFRAAAPSLSNVMSKCQRPSILRAHGRRTARRHGMLPVAACCISRRSLGPFDLSVLSFVQTVAWAAPSEGPIVSAALNCVFEIELADFVANSTGSRGEVQFGRSGSDSNCPSRAGAAAGSGITRKPSMYRT